MPLNRQHGLHGWNFGKIGKLIRLIHVLERGTLARNCILGGFVSAIRGQPQRVPEAQVIGIERKLIGIVARARVGFRVYVIGVVECVVAHAHSDHRYPDRRLAACYQRA